MCVSMYNASSQHAKATTLWISLDGYQLMIFTNTYSIFLIRATAIVTNFCSEKSGSCSPDCFQALAVLKEAAIVDLPSQAVNCSCDGMTSWCGHHQPTQWLSTERRATHQKVLIQKTVKSPGAESRWQEQLQRNHQGTTSLLYGRDPIMSLSKPTKPGQERNTFRNTVSKMFCLPEAASTWMFCRFVMILKQA